MDKQDEAESVSGENSFAKNENSGFEDRELIATPLKKYVTMFGDRKEARKWLCNFGCKSEPYTGTYSRIRAHLIGLLPGQKSQGVALCSKVTNEDREKMRKEEEEAKRIFADRRNLEGESKRKSRGHRLPLLATPTALPLSKLVANDGIENGRAFADLYPTSSIDEVDGSIARFFYSCGIPFNVAKSPFWVDMVKAIREAPKGYEPPSAAKLKTVLLDKEKTKVDQACLSMKHQWPISGVSIVSVGWADLEKDCFVKVMAVSEGKTMLISGINCSEDDLSSELVAEALLKAIESVGAYSVVQVITDDLYACRVAGKIITKAYPHIFWSVCMAKTLSLLLKDIVKSKHPSLSFVAKCYSQAKEVINYVKHHESSLHIFRTFSELGILQVRKRRYGQHFVILDRILRLKTSLTNMILSKEWEKIKKGRSKSRIEHEEVRKIVLDDEFWKMLKIILRFMKPIWHVICFFSSEKVSIGDTCPKMDDLLGSIKSILSDNVDLCKAIQKLYFERYKKLNLPLHALAYALTPSYYSDNWLTNSSPGGERRKQPDVDDDVRKVYLNALDRLVRDSKEASLVRQQLGDYIRIQCLSLGTRSVQDGETLSALSWWHLHGTNFPELYALAVKVLSQCVSSACAERGLSTCDYIHSVKRNVMNGGRADSLVYVHYNNRFLKRFRGGSECLFNDWDDFIGDDNLEIDMEAVEGREDNMLQTTACVAAQIMPTNCVTPLQSSQISFQRFSPSIVEECSRRKRPHAG